MPVIARTKSESPYTSRAGVDADEKVEVDGDPAARLQVGAQESRHCHELTDGDRRFHLARLPNLVPKL